MEDENSSKFNDNKSNFNEKLLIKTQSTTNKKSKLLSLDTIRSFSVKNENDKNKNKTKEKEINYMYDKQIFEPIYSQIRQNMKDFDEEIKTGKKLLKPSKKVEKQIFHYNFKGNNLLLQKKSSLKKKSDICLNNKKSFFLKTFSGNINNLYTENVKKRVMFKNQHLNNIINSKMADDNRLSIKSYTERKMKSEENKNNLNDDLKLNIPLTKKKSKMISGNIDNKLVSTNSLLNVSQVNRTLTNSTLQENTNQNNCRYKTYYIEYDPKWYFKNKLVKPHFEKETISNPLFQKKIIDDELILVFENMKIFLTKFLVNKNLYRDFNKLSNFSKININTNLEEATGLLTEISYLLLDNYSSISEKYISNPIPRNTVKKEIKVDSEKKEFKINTTSFYESYIFLKVCYETYKIILITKKGFCLSKNTFEMLFQYLDRVRLTISKICSELNTLYQEPNQDDIKLIDRCMNRIKKNHLKLLNNMQFKTKRNDDLIFTSKSFSRTKFLKKFNSKYKSKIDCHQKFGLFHSGIDSFNYKGPKKLKLSEYQSMKLRINKAFNQNSRNARFKHVNKFDINSPLVNSLMKYATYKFKSDIISERIRQRFYQTDND